MSNFRGNLTDILATQQPLLFTDCKCKLCIRASLQHAWVIHTNKSAESQSALMQFIISMTSDFVFRTKLNIIWDTLTQKILCQVIKFINIQGYITNVSAKTKKLTTRQCVWIDVHKTRFFGYIESYVALLNSINVWHHPCLGRLSGWIRDSKVKINRRRTLQQCFRFRRCISQVTVRIINSHYTRQQSQ